MTLSGASAAGAEAVIAAYERIQADRADLMIAGGTEAPICELMMAAFHQNHTGSRLGVWRPFDVRSDGTILGEGAGVLVLEEFRHARARRAHIYGEILGYGLRSDAFDMIDVPATSAPGLTACLIEALSDACREPAQVDYINAHGTGTRVNDLAESHAINTVFGSARCEKPLFVSAIKGSVGHMLGGVGAVELIATLLSTSSRVIPPTYGLESPDPQCDLTCVMVDSARGEIDTAISTSVGMGGCNSAIVIQSERSVS
jgi:3-oxoacyl-[acyl-carrier-protein] synthase II